VLQLLAEFFSQSGEKFGHCVKKIGHFSFGDFFLKNLAKFSHRIFGLSICFQRFQSYAAKFSAQWQRTAGQ
jgi:hypothetical protein